MYADENIWTFSACAGQFVLLLGAPFNSDVYMGSTER